MSKILHNSFSPTDIAPSRPRGWEGTAVQYPHCPHLDIGVCGGGGGVVSICAANAHVSLWAHEDSARENEGAKWGLDTSAR